jgi:single-strand selective monofunctional uracil DNA glycosylase
MRTPVEPHDVDLVAISRTLSRRVDALRFGAPVTHVYNPLVYARAPHEAYLKRWGAARGRVLLVGMNPGPFGMMQTGVPFGEVAAVRDWIGIDEPVKAPSHQHPARPIEGFACRRAEVSGARVWGWARERFGTPEAFFARFFIVNYCPLVFLESSGKNRTPDKLPAAERDPLHAACDAALADAMDVLQPSRVIGVGAFAHGRARPLAESRGIATGTILHPSPASPAANRGWAEQAEAQLEALGVTITPVGARGPVEG